MAVALLIGAVLRLGNLSQIAVEHFDEAVYASNLLFPAEGGGEYPYRQFYAPPLLPAAIEWTTILGQAFPATLPSWWPMLPALVCGLTVIPSVWWIARRWFSPRAGIVAALLIAGNEYHAAYCRTALTDVPLSLFVLWAVHWFWCALRTGSTRDAIIAGLFTSLAWWTKYNGWLPLAIAAAGGIAWQVITPRRERNWSRGLRVWAIAAATAFILWLPVLWDCQSVGGYAAVATNHQRYVDGFSKWGGNLWLGAQRLTGYNDFVTLHIVGLALLVILFGPRLINRSAPTDRSRDESWLAISLAAAWFWGLMLATPMYYPYPRLWQPWMISVSLMTVGGILGGWRWPIRNLGDAMKLLSRISAGIGLALLLLPGVTSVERIFAWPTSWEPRRGALVVSEQISLAVADLQSPVFVVSEPAVWYHLRERNQAAVISDGVTFLNQPLPASAWLVVGPQASRDLEGTEEWNRAVAQLEPAGEFTWQPSRIVLFDSFSPLDLKEHPVRGTMTVRLYKVRPQKKSG